MPHDRVVAQCSAVLLHLCIHKHTPARFQAALPVHCCTVCLGCSNQAGRQAVYQCVHTTHALPNPARPHTLCHNAHTCHMHRHRNCMVRYAERLQQPPMSYHTSRPPTCMTGMLHKSKRCTKAQSGGFHKQGLVCRNRHALCAVTTALLALNSLQQPPKPPSQRVMVAKGACLDPAKAGSDQQPTQQRRILSGHAPEEHPTALITRTAPSPTPGYQTCPIAKQMSQTTIDRSQAGFGVLSSHSAVAVPE